MKRTMIASLACAWALLGFLGPPAYALEDEECMFCHGEADLTKETEGGELIHLYVDQAAFGNSVHAENGCVSCHVDIEELPHEEGLELVNCGACHEEAEQYVESLHGVALKNGDKDAAICHDCHSKHDIRPVTSVLSPVHPRNLPYTCGRCHSDTALTKRHMVSVTKPSDAYIKSVHGKAVVMKGLETAAVCNDCHGTHDMLPSQDPNSAIFWLNIPQTCGQCHSGVVRTYAESIHGRALMAGIKDAPNCTSCHGEHNIESHLLEGSATSPQQISRATCVRCHENERIMSRYGVEVHRQASYMDSYHGVTSTAGANVAANCTSCHGVHNILQHDDPLSSIHPDNLVETCRRCHENANANFAASPVHVVPAATGRKLQDLVQLAYIWLIVLVIGFMLMHNGLLLLRRLVAKFAQSRPGGETHKRFGWGLRLGHAVLAISFIVLAETGFALRYPEGWWVRLFFVGDPSLALRSSIHRSAGIVMTLVFVLDLVYLVASAKGRNEFRALFPRIRDAKDLIHNLGYVLGLKREEADADRYGYKEKLEYWGLVWGSMVMVVTGFCMWYASAFMTYFPKVALDIVALVHFFEAVLAVLTILVWHMYFIVMDPDVYPMNWSWLTGHIPLEAFKKHHAREFERETRQETAPEELPKTEPDRT